MFGSSVSSTYAPFRVTNGRLFDSRFRSIQSTVDVHNPDDPSYAGIIELQSAYHCSFEGLFKKPPSTACGPNKVTIRAVDFYGNRAVTSPTTPRDNDSYFNVSGSFSGNFVIHMPAAGEAASVDAQLRTKVHTDLSFTATLVFNEHDARVFVLTPVGDQVIQPASSAAFWEGHTFRVINRAAGNSITVKDPAGGALGVVGPGQAGLFLFDGAGT